MKATEEEEEAEILLRMGFVCAGCGMMLGSDFVLVARGFGECQECVVTTWVEFKR